MTKNIHLLYRGGGMQNNTIVKSHTAVFYYTENTKFYDIALNIIHKQQESYQKFNRQLQPAQNPEQLVLSSKKLIKGQVMKHLIWILQKKEAFISVMNYDYAQTLLWNNIVYSLNHFICTSNPLHFSIQQLTQISIARLAIVTIHQAGHAKRILHQACSFHQGTPPSELYQMSSEFTSKYKNSSSEAGFMVEYEIFGVCFQKCLACIDYKDAQLINSQNTKICELKEMALKVIERDPKTQTINYPMKTYEISSSTYCGTIRGVPRVGLLRKMSQEKKNYLQWAAQYKQWYFRQKLMQSYGALSNQSKDLLERFQEYHEKMIESKILKEKLKTHIKFNRTEYTKEQNCSRLSDDEQMDSEIACLIR